MHRIRGRFYGAASVGLCVWIATFSQHEMLRVLLAADVFFVLFVGQIVYAALTLPAAEVRLNATQSTKRGSRLMVSLAGVAVIVSLVAIFTLLNHPTSEGAFFPIVAVASVPLSWAMLHTIAGVYYARLYYASETWGEPVGGLGFPEGGDPSGFDFLYHAVVIGTSSSVSDVNTTSRELRMATMLHSLASFVFNTVLIAIAVNAAMTFTS